jgi:hypothetical protein
VCVCARARTKVYIEEKSHSSSGVSICAFVQESK